MIWTIRWHHQPASYNSPTPRLYLIHLNLVLSDITSSGTFTVSGPLFQPIRAWVGEDVQLSRQLSPKMDVQGMIVKWVRGPLVVHLYRMGQEMEEVQAPAFQGRTKMLRQDMAEGKVTVRIHQVQLSDTGQYACYFQEGSFYNETSFDLQVAERQEGAFSVIGSAQLIRAKQGEDITLSCQLSPKMDAWDMTVNWFRNQTLVHRYPTGEKLEGSQGTEFQGRTELLKCDMAEGKVTLRIQQVQVSDSGPYTCHFRSPDNCDEAHIELHVAGTFTVSGPLLQPIRAWVGDDVQLSCHLSPKIDVRGMIVKWVRGPLVVHLYRMGQEMEEVQAPAFQGRTKMLRQDMAEGKVTMIIHQVKLSDTGQYACYFQEGSFYNETSFDLQVSELPTGPFTVIGPAQVIQAKQGEDIMFSCHLSPKMDARKMTVKCFRDQTLVHEYCNKGKVEETQDPEFHGRTKMLKYDMAEGKVILSIHQVQVSDAGQYICHFRARDYSNDAHFELQVEERIPTSEKTLLKKILLVLPVVFIGSLFMIYFFCQMKLRRTRGLVEEWRLLRLPFAWQPAIRVVPFNP
ncbi:butyrophilin-like protein 2 isoform X3 [Vombatus ursinus]|uniref:butyrophilin-like protein 2 isoform X3 n=1 Tax=Vombatus ursinus TaxID=29139 RepID=UPI000FFD16C3|nr:butyrophilin-like protein 2 isoform X3 [Vombatus ursinus]